MQILSINLPPKVVNYSLSFGNAKKNVISKTFEISKKTLLPTAGALAVMAGVTTTAIKTKELADKSPHKKDRIGKGFENIYIKNMNKEMQTCKKEMEPLDDLTKDEYLRLLLDVFDIDKSTSELNERYIYPDCPDKYLGLIPYCGLYDFSLQINQYLSNRIVEDSLKYLRVGNLNKSCSTLDYSLKELDNEYGKYEGTTYRIGFFEPSSSQFYSASSKPLIEMYLKYLVDTKNSNLYNTQDVKIHIIKTKNGHKINDFQKDYCEPILEEFKEVREDFINENEILLDRKSRYQKAHDSQELQYEKLNIARDLFKTLKNKNILGWNSFEEIINKIEIWEEI